MLLYQIALTLVPGVGDILAKKLVTLCGSPEAVFREPGRYLMKARGLRDAVISALKDKEIFRQAEKEVAFIEKNRITALSFQDPGYPARLKHCADGPFLLYFKGNSSMNARYSIGIVGTRSATDYGKEVCHKLADGLKDLEDLLIVSGLAYGIDSAAHRASLENGQKTIAVLGHGLDRIYPWPNRSLAERITGQGGLLTDFMSGTQPDRENFPKRNRIIAGMCDAVVVVEAAAKGGALITAEIAQSYNRDVFAVPGRIGDPCSEGCHYLIQNNVAALIQSAEDIKLMMGWKKKEAGNMPVQRKLFTDLSPEEQRIVDIISETGSAGIDDISLKGSFPMSKTSSLLLNLEFEGVVRCMPGKIYSMA